MIDALIFYGYTPTRRRWECQPSVESVLALGEAGYHVLWHPCREDTDYAHGLRLVWRHTGPLVIIEHDMVVPPARLAELLACPQPICAVPYWIALGVAGRRPMLSACVAPDPDHLGNRPRLIDSDTQAGYTGIGCCKLSRATREAMALPRIVTWTDVEHEVNQAVTVAGYWHIHWPVVEHNHGFMEMRNGNQLPSDSCRANERTDRTGLSPVRGGRSDSDQRSARAKLLIGRDSDSSSSDPLAAGVAL